MEDDFIVVKTYNWSKIVTVKSSVWHFIPKGSCKIVNTLPSDIFKVSAISPNFNLRSLKTILWSFVMFSGTTADFKFWTKHQIVMKFWHLTFEVWYYPKIIWIWQQWCHLYVGTETYWVMCYWLKRGVKKILILFLVRMKLIIINNFLSTVAGLCYMLVLSA